MLSESKENIVHIPFIKSNSAFFSFSYTIFYYVIALHIILYFLLYICNYYFNKYKIIFYSNKNKDIIYYSYMIISKSFFDFIIDAIHLCNKKIFSFLGSFFILLLSYNCASLIPHFEEITSNLNVCLAFAIYGFLHIQYIAIDQVGLDYLHHWIVVLIRPIKNESKFLSYLYLIIAIIVNTIATICLFPFTILEKLSLLFSLTFRLFGNIFGGSIVIKLLQKAQNAALVYYLGTTLFGVQLLVLFYFNLFEGVIQAFVFSLILLNNLGTLINKDH